MTSDDALAVELVAAALSPIVVWNLVGWPWALALVATAALGWLAGRELRRRHLHRQNRRLRDSSRRQLASAARHYRDARFARLPHDREPVDLDALTGEAQR